MTRLNNLSPGRRSLWHISLRFGVSPIMHRAEGEVKHLFERIVKPLEALAFRDKALVKRDATPKIIYFTVFKQLLSSVALQGVSIMSPFLRIGLSNFDCGSCQSCQGEAVNPYCAVLVKEYVESGKLEWVLGVRGGGRGSPCSELGSKAFQGLQGRLTQPDFPAQETMPREAKCFLGGSWA